MKRLDNWQTNLSSVIEEARFKEFDFPKWNCLMWAIKAIQATTGQDVGGTIRDNFKDEKSAARLLRRLHSVKTSQAFLQIYLGELQAISLAKKGDIVFADESNLSLDLPEDVSFFGPVPGVCYGSVSFFVGEKGLIAINTFELDAALWVS